MECRYCDADFWDYDEYGEVRENICDDCHKKFSKDENE